MPLQPYQHYCWFSIKSKATTLPISPSSPTTPTPKSPKELKTFGVEWRSVNEQSRIKQIENKMFRSKATAKLIIRSDFFFSPSFQIDHINSEYKQETVTRFLRQYIKF